MALGVFDWSSSVTYVLTDWMFLTILYSTGTECEIRKNDRWTQRYSVSNVSMEELSRDLSATVLIKLTKSSDSHQLQCMKLQHFKLYIDFNRSRDNYLN